MGARLQTRIERIEEQNAPLLRLIKQRQKISEFYRRSIQPDIDRAAEFSSYVMGCPADRESVEYYLHTSIVLSVMEYEIHYPYDKWIYELVINCIVYADMRMAREFDGRELTFEEAKREGDIRDRTWVDFRGGVPFDKSEAAQQLRATHEQYPRLNFESPSLAAYLGGADVRTL